MSVAAEADIEEGRHLMKESLVNRRMSAERRVRINMTPDWGFRATRKENRFI
jgi:hypothetical protein